MFLMKFQTVSKTVWIAVQIAVKIALKPLISAVRKFLIAFQTLVAIEEMALQKPSQKFWRSVQRPLKKLMKAVIAALIQEMIAFQIAFSPFHRPSKIHCPISAKTLDGEEIPRPCLKPSMKSLTMPVTQFHTAFQAASRP